MTASAARLPAARVLADPKQQSAVSAKARMPAAMPYRVAIRDAGSAGDVTAWLDDHLEAGNWRVELLDVEEYDDHNRAIRFAVRFKNRDDMLQFKEVWLKLKPPQEAPPAGYRTLRGWRALRHCLLHPSEPILVKDKP